MKSPNADNDSMLSWLKPFAIAEILICTFLSCNLLNRRYDKKQLTLDLWLTQFFTDGGCYQLAETDAFRDLFLKMMPKATVLKEVEFIRYKQTNDILSSHSHLV